MENSIWPTLVNDWLWFGWPDLLKTVLGEIEILGKGPLLEQELGVEEDSVFGFRHIEYEF